MVAAEILCYDGFMELRLSGHGAYRTQYHICWIPKYRRRILNAGVRGYMVKLLPKVLQGMPGCEITECNIQVDHIHILMIIPPRYAVSDVVGRMKGITAHQLRKKFDWLKNVYWKENIVWSPGYFVSTVGIDEEQIIQYIRWQERQDSGQAKLEFF
jgi:putative transposase